MAKNLPKSVLHLQIFCFDYKPQCSYSLELLPSNFPDMEKVWKMEIKSGKMGKSPEFLSKLQQAGFICNFFFVFRSSLTQFSPHICVPALFKVSIDHLFNNLESGKEIIVLEKVWKKS